MQHKFCKFSKYHSFSFQKYGTLTKHFFKKPKNLFLDFCISSTLSEIYFRRHGIKICSFSEQLNCGNIKIFGNILTCPKRTPCNISHRARCTPCANFDGQIMRTFAANF